MTPLVISDPPRPNPQTTWRLKYAGLSVRTLRAYLHDPTVPLPHYRVRGKILVRRSDYDAWVLQFRQRGAPMLNSIVDDVLRGL